VSATPYSDYMPHNTN